MQNSSFIWEIEVEDQLIEMKSLVVGEVFFLFFKLLEGDFLNLLQHKQESFVGERSTQCMTIMYLVLADA